MASKPLVSIVVLNWNGLEDTKVCLESLKKLDYPNYEIIVVDNGSEDGSKKYLKTLKDIIYIDLPKNTGFTGGHIEGYKRSKGSFIALLNNDAVVAKDWLTRVMEVFEKHKDAAGVGGKSFMWGDDFKAYDTSSPFYSYQEVDPNNAQTITLMTGEEECFVDSISGAALVLDKAKLKDVGYLDDRFFAYYEETDLLARLKRKGHKIYYTPTAHIWHKIAASSEGGSDGEFYLRQMHRNRFYFAYKNFDELNLKRFLASYNREVLKAKLINLRSRGNNLEAKCRIKAKKEIDQNMGYLKSERSKIIKLGNSYNSTLNNYIPDDVTIIIPNYNYANHVSEAIESAINQSIKPKRIIVIDDGSKDNSLEVLKAYKDHPLVEVVSKKNEGVIATKNLGIKLSKTYWTMFLDADDIIDEDTLRIMLKAVKNEGKADVIYSDMRMFGAISDIFKAKPFQANSFLAKNYINNTTLINTSFLKRSGGYKSAMAGGLEDWELYVTLFEQGAVFKYIPQPLVWYRQHGQGVTSRNTEVQDVEKGRKLFNQIKSLHPGLYKKYGKRRLGARLIYGLFIVARKPYVFVVAVKSIPGAIKQSLRHILHNVRIYLHNS